MKNLNEFKIIYAKHSYKDVTIEAENKADANFIAKLKCPKGYYPLLVEESNNSIFKRIFDK